MCLAANSRQAIKAPATISLKKDRRRRWRNCANLVVLWFSRWRTRLSRRYIFARVFTAVAAISREENLLRNSGARMQISTHIDAAWINKNTWKQPRRCFCARFLSCIHGDFVWNYWSSALASAAPRASLYSFFAQAICIFKVGYSCGAVLTHVIMLKKCAKPRQCTKLCTT